MSLTALQKSSDEFRIACLIAANPWINIKNMNNARPKKNITLKIQIGCDTILIHDSTIGQYSLSVEGVPMLRLQEEQMKKAIKTYTYLLRSLKISTDTGICLTRRYSSGQTQSEKTRLRILMEGHNGYDLAIDERSREFRFACFIAANPWIDLSHMNIVDEQFRKHDISITSSARLLFNDSLSSYKLVEDGNAILCLTSLQMKKASASYSFVLGMIKINVGPKSDLRSISYDAYTSSLSESTSAPIAASNPYDSARSASKPSPKLNSQSKKANSKELLALEIAGTAIICGLVGIPLAFLLSFSPLYPILIVIVAAVVAALWGPKEKTNNSRPKRSIAQPQSVAASMKYHESGTVIIYTPNGPSKCAYMKGTVSGHFSLSEVKSIRQVNEASAQNFAKKVGWGTAAFIGLGTVFSGGLGIIGAGAALLAAGNSKKITFVVTLNSGEEVMITSSDKIYIEFVHALQ